jgi:hypothetical protein
MSTHHLFLILNPFFFLRALFVYLFIYFLYNSIYVTRVYKYLYMINPVPVNSSESASVSFVMTACVRNTWFTLIRGYIQKFPNWVDNEINNKHSLRSDAKGCGGKTHYTDSQNSNTTALSSRELYHLQFSLQAACPETFGYSLINSNP